MYSTANLIELYTDFFRIDMDARGGYARVADVTVRLADGTPVHRAFKLMRHELDDKPVGMQRFENELRILIDITNDTDAPLAITRVYDSGFAPVALSQALHNLHVEEKLSPNLEIISTGKDLTKFLEVKSGLMTSEPDRWLPYLVVELAPFDDCLLRQINPRSEREKSNLYRLPANSITEMAIQLLDVMDYLHKKLRYAYTDWKPEHIYWNETTEQLKLIDWNVTTRLRDSTRERQLIREDLRMFCGAALYCSLALTDPENLTRAIGPAPTIPRERVPLIPPRYWTDKPNFYEREMLLDEEIKQIVQKGLDPKQGFNSPTELTNELTEYAAQLEKQKGVQNDDQGSQDLIAKLPQEAVQNYRKARSYIAGEDYFLAAGSLTTAIDTARLAGMTYPDAEELLESVQNILQADQFREKVKEALQHGEWDAALTRYRKALALVPTNENMRKEFEGLQKLRRSEAQLRNNSSSRLLINTFRLQAALESTKEVLNTENPIYVSIQKQLKQIRILQFSGLFTLLFVVLGLAFSGKLGFPGLIPAATSTLSSTPTHVVTLTPAVTLTPTPVSPTAEPSITSTPTVTATATVTSEPTATVTTVLNYGVLNVAFFYPVNRPNGARIGIALEIDQFVMIVDSALDREQLWYKCIWEKDSVPGEGWILAENIQFVPPPTPTP